MRSVHTWLLLVLLISLVTGSFGCQEELDPVSLVNKLRILGIAAEPADLAEGETTTLTVLISHPEDVTLEYEWELCIIDNGPTELYECANDELDVPPEFLDFFDLGTGPTAEVSYFFDAQMLQDQCYEFVGQLQDFGDLGTLVDLPNCDLGLEMRVRLTVRAGDEVQIATKRLFFWFIDPEDLQRNNNPQIDFVAVNGTPIPADGFLAMAPDGEAQFFVSVSESEREWFLPRDPDPGEEQRQEEILFSWFTFDGDWRRDRSFADGEDFTLTEGGLNDLTFEDALQDGDILELNFVVRDGRGGVGWETREVRIIEPSGGQPSP